LSPRTLVNADTIAEIVRRFLFTLEVGLRSNFVYGLLPL